MRTNRTFTVLVYVDYRKEVEIEILKSFMKKEAAIAFANKTLQFSEQQFKEKYPEYFQEEEESGEHMREVGEYVRLEPSNVIFQKRMRAYKDFFDPILAVVENEIDME
jgi:hypothetical protein